jgi:predicted MFS family arabinose efflux permease
MSMTAVSETERSRIKNWQWGILALAILAEIFLAADWYGFAAVLTFVSESIHLQPWEAGFAQGIFAISYGVGMFFWSPVSRTMSSRRMLVIGLIGSGIGMAVQVFVQGFAELVVLRIIIGFFDAAVWTGNIKLMVGWWPESRRASIMGIILAAYSLAITMDFALGIPLTISFGWRTFFATLAVLTLLVGVLDLIFVRDNPQDIGIKDFVWELAKPVTSSNTSLWEIFKSRWIYVGALGIGGCTFALSGTATWVIPTYIKVQDMPVGYAALVGTAMGLSQVVFLVIGGYVTDWFDNRPAILKFGAFLGVLVGLSFILTAVNPMGFGALLAIAALSGAAVFAGGAIFSLLSQKYPDRIVPAAIGYAEVMGVFATFLSPSLMGLVINITGSFAWAFIAYTLCEVAVLVVLLVLAREPSRSGVASVGPAAAH